MKSNTTHPGTIQPYGNLHILEHHHLPVIFPKIFQWRLKNLHPSHHGQISTPKIHPKASRSIPHLHREIPGFSHGWRSARVPRVGGGAGGTGAPCHKGGQAGCAGRLKCTDCWGHQGTLWLSMGKWCDLIWFLMILNMFFCLMILDEFNVIVEELEKSINGWRLEHQS